MRIHPASRLTDRVASPVDGSGNGVSWSASAPGSSSGFHESPKNATKYIAFRQAKACAAEKLLPTIELKIPCSTSKDASHCLLNINPQVAREIQGLMGSGHPSVLRKGDGFSAPTFFESRLERPRSVLSCPKEFRSRLAAVPALSENSLVGCPANMCFKVTGHQAMIKFRLHSQV
jgi:hypothetical protein